MDRGQTRKLAAIMFTDIANFTQITSLDEEKAVELIKIQKSLFYPIVKQFNGSWLKEMGDGLLLSFDSSKNAIRCGIKLQTKSKNIDDLNIRIGIHQGDVIISGDDILGDDVNIASKIEPLSATGGIAISEKVLMDLSSSPEFRFKFLGSPKLKGVKQNVKVFSLSSHSLPVPEIKAGSFKKKQNQKVSSFVSLFISIVFSIFIFFSYPYIIPYFENDSYTKVKIGDFNLEYKNSSKSELNIDGLQLGISKKILDANLINLIELNKSKASISGHNKFLLLNANIKESQNNIEVLFLLNRHDGTIFNQYSRKYPSTSVKDVFTNLVGVIPIWLHNSILKDQVKNIDISDKNIKGSDYPIEYYEILGMLKSTEKSGIQNAIILLEELKINDESKWIDLILAESYITGYVEKGYKNFLNKSEIILSKNTFTKKNDKAYESYLKSLIYYSKANVDSSIVFIKQAIKLNQYENRYKDFHHKVRSIKLEELITNAIY